MTQVSEKEFYCIETQEDHLHVVEMLRWSLPDIVDLPVLETGSKRTIYRRCPGATRGTCLYQKTIQDKPSTMLLVLPENLPISRGQNSSHVKTVDSPLPYSKSASEVSDDIVTTTACMQMTVEDRDPKNLDLTLSLSGRHPMPD